MSAITSSAVTIVESWRSSVNGRNLLHRLLDITLASQGGTADDIPASVLGFAKIYTAQSCGLIATSGGALHCVPVVVEDDQAGILTVNIEAATDADRSNPANPPVDGDLRVLITGIEA